MIKINFWQINLNWSKLISEFTKIGILRCEVQACTCTTREYWEKNLHHLGKVKFCTTRGNSWKMLNFAPNFVGKNYKENYKWKISWILNNKDGHKTCSRELGNYKDVEKIFHGRGRGVSIKFVKKNLDWILHRAPLRKINTCHPW